MSAVQCINIADILEGIHMTEKIEMQTLICLAVFMRYNFFIVRSISPQIS